MAKTVRIIGSLTMGSCRTITFQNKICMLLAGKIEWDDDFGENLSALWDILWGMPYGGDDFSILRLHQYTNIPHGQDTVFTEYVDKICAIFQRAQSQGLITVDIRYHNSSNDHLSDYFV